MNFSQLINNLLSVSNVAVIRRNSLNRILEENNRLREESHLASLQPPQSSTELDDPAIDVRQIDSLRSELLRHQIASKWQLADLVMRVIAREAGSRTCPLCGCENDIKAFTKFESHCIFGGGYLLRYQCPACDVIFGPEKILQLSSAALAQEYEWHYRAYEEGDSTPQELRAFHCLRPMIEGTYLNYGAGAWSRSVQILRNEGWQVMAYEPHGSASSGADYVISSRSHLSSMRFDGIFSNNVLEHLRQPVSELSYMRGLLKSGGRMSHATPCFEYLYEYTRFHLFFFLGRSPAFLAREAGLSINEHIIDGEFMCLVLEPTE